MGMETNPKLMLPFQIARIIAVEGEFGLFSMAGFVSWFPIVSRQHSKSSESTFRVPS
jgi:hypothetical protein